MNSVKSSRIIMITVLLLAVCMSRGVSAASMTWQVSVETIAALVTLSQDVIDQVQDNAENGAAQAVSVASDSGNAIGSVSVSALADGQNDPNGTARLQSTLTCDYTIRDFWVLADYFYQDGFVVIDANYVIPGTAADLVCGVEYEVTFPQDTLAKENTEWELVIYGPYSNFEAGYNATVGEFGYPRGMLTAVTGFPMKIELRHGVLGYWSIPDTGGIGEFLLVRGTQQLQVEFRRIDHPADFNADGAIDLADFSLLSRHWLSANCSSQNNWCDRADINRSSGIDYGDLAWLSYYWLINE